MTLWEYNIFRFKMMHILNTDDGESAWKQGCRQPCLPRDRHHWWL